MLISLLEVCFPELWLLKLVSVQTLCRVGIDPKGLSSPDFLLFCLRKTWFVFGCKPQIKKCKLVETDSVNFY